MSWSKSSKHIIKSTYVEEVVAQKYVYYTKTYVYLNLLGLE